VPARLHHERLTAAGAAPARTLLFTHGIYGSGGNWRALARQLVDQRPEWSVVLVDLRGHGRSEHGEPPHTIAACAEDLRALAGELGGVAALAGHSYGGKVMLAVRAGALAGIEQTWALDSSPSPRPGAMQDPANSVERVLEIMESLPRVWPAREPFVAAVMAAGQPRTLAQWLAMNLQQAVPGELVLRLDLLQLRALLSDYYVQDLWPAVDDAALPGTVEIVIADRSNVITAADRERLARGSPPHVHAHHVDADHWINVDAPAAVLELFVEHLP
jgi:pimeloyl-ACP methyl ester carboxylesterase